MERPAMNARHVYPVPGQYDHRVIACRFCSDDHLHRRPYKSTEPWVPGEYVQSEAGSTWTPVHPGAPAPSESASTADTDPAPPPTPALERPELPTSTTPLPAGAGLRPGWRELPEPYNDRPRYTCRVDDNRYSWGVVFWNDVDRGWDACRADHGFGDDLAAAMRCAERLCPPHDRRAPAAPPGPPPELCFVCANDRDAGECPQGCRSKLARWWVTYGRAADRAPAEPAVAAPSPEPQPVMVSGRVRVTRRWFVQNPDAALRTALRYPVDILGDTGRPDLTLQGAAITPEHEPPSAREGAAPVCVRCGRERNQHAPMRGKHFCFGMSAGDQYEPAAPQPVAETVGRPTTPEQTPPMWHVEMGRAGCDGCGVGASWDIVGPFGPDECALGTSYGDKMEAEDIAGHMNDAAQAGYDAGHAAAQAELERRPVDLAYNTAQLRHELAAERAKREAAERRVVELEGERGMVEHAHELDVTNQRLRAEKAESALAAIRDAADTLCSADRVLCEVATVASYEDRDRVFVLTRNEQSEIEHRAYNAVAARDALRAALRPAAEKEPTT